jgi:hypothetical protein
LPFNRAPRHVSIAYCSINRFTPWGNSGPIRNSVGKLRPHSPLRGGTQAPFATPLHSVSPGRPHTRGVFCSGLSILFKRKYIPVSRNQSFMPRYSSHSVQTVHFVHSACSSLHLCLSALSVCASVAHNAYCCCSVRAVTFCACSRVQYLRVFALNFSKTSSHLLEQMLISSPSARSSYLPIKMTMN